jgi:transglutaminase-like putative cysteine protease
VAAGTATVLASIALYPLLATGSWFWAGIGAVIVIGAVGAVTRRRAIPAAVCFLAAVAALFLYLNAVFAGRRSWAGLVPTGASLHELGVLVAQAMAEKTKYAPPVPGRPGIVMVTVAGIGLVAALTDVLAVRLHRPAIAGLPLLVLFCVPLSIDAHTGAVGSTLVFCAGMVGYLGLLSADGRHRLRLWGRLIHPWQDEGDSQGPDVRPLAAAGRRIGSTAVVLALALPLLIPGLKAHRLFPGTGGKGTGQGQHSQLFFPRPLDLLNTDLHESRPQTVLYYRYTAKDTQPPYLQVYVLGNLSTNAWTMGRPAATTPLTRRGLPQVQGLARTTPTIALRETISLAHNLSRSGNVNYLPLPYPARQVSVPGQWRVDPTTLAVLSANAHLGGLRYIVTAKDVNPAPQQLRETAVIPGSVAGYLSVPGPYRTKTLRRLAHKITAHQANPYDKAVALQDWFTSPDRFTYSLRGVNSSQSPLALEQFLKVTRKGYCQQFAFAMAVLARLVGIPSRVVVGYTQGTFAGNSTWQVKTSDAHAWPELYFPGSGWLRFEPTPPDPAGLPGQATATVPPYSVPQADRAGILGTQPGGTTSASSSQGGGKPKSSSQFAGKITAATGSGRTAGAHHRNAAPIVAVVIALLVLMLVAPAITRAVARRWRWWRAHDDASRAHVAWHELRNDLTDHRVAYRASESPRALSRRLITSLGLAGAEREAIERIARAEERASYALSPADSARLQADVTRVRRGMARACGRSARWSAIVAPPSALIPLRTALAHTLDVFGWIELATTKARHRVAAGGGTLPSDKPAPA